MGVERDFVQNTIVKMKIEDYLKNKIRSAGVSKVEIQRTPLITRVIIHVRRPGVVIGKKGRAINELSEDLKTKFGIENPRIDIKAVEVPELDATLMAQRIARMLERGMKFRSVVYRTLSAIMSKRPTGAEILVKGTIGGRGKRARAHRIIRGFVPKAGEPAEKLVDHGYDEAVTKVGTIGVHVKITPPGIELPDKIYLDKGEESGGTGTVEE